jgi:hypothetical protein
LTIKTEERVVKESKETQYDLQEESTHNTTETPTRRSRNHPIRKEMSSSSSGGFNLMGANAKEIPATPTSKDGAINYEARSQKLQDEYARLETRMQEGFDLYERQVDKLESQIESLKETNEIL